MTKTQNKMHKTLNISENRIYVKKTNLNKETKTKIIYQW